MRLEDFLNESFNKKYPRTFHFPWSEEIHSDDKVIKDISNLLSKPLMASIKMDGSNVGISFETISSRSGMKPDHPSFDLLKQKYATIKYDIPKGIVIYGEWLYAKHSISYDNLDDYLMVFAILDNDTWLSWKDVEEYCGLLGLNTVQVINKNFTVRTEEELREITTKFAHISIKQGHEGIVVRNINSFKDFQSNTAKFVRKGHVQTDKHWMFKTIERNELKS